VKPIELADLLVETLRLSSPGPAPGIWRTVRTRDLRALVSHEQCAGWLYRRLRTLGLLAEVEENFRGWLDAAARRIAARNALLDSTRDDVARILSNENIPFIFLKGTALRLLAREHPMIDARSSVDVDLLVPEELCLRVWQHLTDHGYHQAFDRSATPEGWIHLPPLTGRLHVAVEIHSSTQADLQPSAAWDRLARSAREVRCGELLVQVPGVTELFWHSLQHALFHGPDGFRLRMLLDGASLMSAGVDFSLVDKRVELGEAGAPSLARAWLSATSSLAAPGAPKARVPGHDVRICLAWMISVSRGIRLARDRVLPRAIEEGRRVELGLPPKPLVDGAGPLLHIRRRTLSSALRLIDRAWRSSVGAPPW
jgi:Uncharacterised nucleotidyltransferase